MKDINCFDDTIVAISTSTGYGGIGIVRLSGPQSLSIADKIFKAKNGMIPSQFKTYTVHYGTIVKKGLNPNKEVIEESVDEVLVTVMRAPKSYTTEDIVEISCHGGPIVLKTILALTVDEGARLAAPGEFTKRAFLNGRIDLTQAEAVLDIIQSKTEAFLKMSTHQLKGDLTIALESIRQELMEIYVELEALINFPEDEIESQGQLAGALQKKSKVSGGEKIDQLLKKVSVRLLDLLESSQEGRILKEGIKVVICGRPNVGKSSLLNVLLKQPRAIVTPVEGTTRDTIEETAQIQGVPFQLVDTAGILEPRDLVEEEAVRRSHLYMEQSDLILFLLDSHQGISSEDKELFRLVEKKNTLVVMNKCDLAPDTDKKDIARNFPGKKILFISALKKISIETLEKAILESVLHGKIVNPHKLIISNVRHVQSLKECLSSVDESFGMKSRAISLEFISEEIKKAINCLDQITGRNVDSDLIEQIFSDFCVGK